MRRAEIGVLLAIIAGYLIIATLYATKTPAWQVPDEPAHYNYVAQLSRGALPVLEMGDWDNTYLDAIKASKFSPQSVAGRLDTVQYEDHQPPLYYLLAAPVFAVTGGNLTALRFFSALIGAGIVLVAYLCIKTLFPDHGYLALGTAGFVAFLPQHLAMMGSVNNDSLTELLVGLTLFACLRWLTDTERGQASSPSRYSVHPVILGLLLGLALITKVTAFSLIFVVGAAVLLRARREGWTLRRIVIVLTWAALPALILGGLWWLSNISVYGFPDFLGLRRHDAVVVGQLRTSLYISQVGLAYYLSDGLQTTFRSFWGQFGWMAVVLPKNIVTLLVIFTSFIIMGAGIAAVQFRAFTSGVQRDGMLLMALLGWLALLLFTYYNLSFVQFQGRYLYTALIPVGFLISAALAGWASLIRGTLARWVITLGAVGLLAFFAVYLLFRVLLPGLA